MSTPVKKTLTLEFSADPDVSPESFLRNIKGIVELVEVSIGHPVDLVATLDGVSLARKAGRWLDGETFIEAAIESSKKSKSSKKSAT